MKLSNIWSPFMDSLVKGHGLATSKGRSPFTGEPLIPPDGKNVVNGYRLTPYQYERVRESNATVLAQHATTREITCSSPVAGKFTVGVSPEEE